MEAKETVMSLDEFNAWSRDWHSFNGVPELYMKADFLNRWELAKLQHQAGISFRAGQEAEREEISKMVMDMYNGAYPAFYNEAIMAIWQALKGESNEQNKAVH